jgi:hypothetical protein
MERLLVLKLNALDWKLPPFPMTLFRLHNRGEYAVVADARPLQFAQHAHFPKIQI